MPIPLRSDRSAWDTVGYANLHARDLENGAPTVHLPSVQPNQVAVWDGTRWIGVPLEAAELLDVDMTQVQDGHVLVYDAVSGKWLTGPNTEMHHLDHQRGGGDEINVDGLSGLLADEQNAGQIKGKPVNLTGLVDGQVLRYDQGTDRFIPDSVAASTPGDHAATHESGGLDEVNVAGLRGLLADPQTPAAHTHNYAAAAHTHADYAIHNGPQIISGAWHFQRTSTAAPFSVQHNVMVNNLNADLLDGYHATGIASAIAKNRNLWVAFGGTGDGSSSGSPLGSIQAAIDKLAGYVVKNCTITVGPGTYNENVDVSGFVGGMLDGLTIQGDACELAGAMFIHGDNYTVNGASYGGIGIASVYSDNSGVGGRMRVWCTRAITNPNFASAGVNGDNWVVIWNGAQYLEYQVYSVSSYVITLNTTATAVSLSVAGRGFAIAPKVRVNGLTVADTYAMEVFQTGVRLKGLYLNGYYGGLRAYIGSIMSERCVYLQRANVNYYGAVHLTSLSFLFSRFDSITDAHNAVFGYWAGLVASYTAHANFGKCFAVSFGGYALYCAAGTVYANGARLLGTGVGVYASARGYVNAAATNAANWATTKYSPATSDAFGNSNASITYS